MVRRTATVLCSNKLIKSFDIGLISGYSLLNKMMAKILDKFSTYRSICFLRALQLRIYKNF